MYWMLLLSVFQTASLATRVDSLVAPLVARGDFAGTILVARGAEIMYLESFGLADVARGIAHTPGVPVGVGSVSKQFTAAAVLLLERDGMLSVEDHVDRYVPSFPHGARITIHHLLTHQSGLIRDVFDDYRERARPRQLAEVVTAFQDRPLQFSPGSQTSYSNAGYTLLAYIVERVSGQPFDEFLRQRVFEPLGMLASGVSLGAAGAIGYDPGPDGVTPAPYQHPANTMGADGVYATVLDLHRWSEALESDDLLDESMRARMLQSYGDGRGYGIGVGRRHGRTAVGHDGITHGFIAFLDRYVDEDLTIAFTGNIRTGVLEHVRVGLGRAVFGGSLPHLSAPEAIPWPPSAELTAVTGRYELFPGFDIDITERDGHLYLLGTGGYPTVLTPIGTDEFFYRARYERIRFERNNGEVTGLTWFDRGGSEYEARRTGPVPSSS